MSRRFHLPSCSACSRASTRLQPAARLKSFKLKTSHGLWGGVDRREKIRQRFPRGDLLVFIQVFLVK